MKEYRYCPLCATTLESRVFEGRQHPACPAAGCGFVHWENPLPVVAALVQIGDAVVMARNRAWPEKVYGLVTGFLEKGEDPAAAVVREVREELGLGASVTAFIGLVPFEAMNQLLIAYHLTATGEPVAGEELAEVKLVPIDRLKAWPFGTGLVVERWLRGRAAGSTAGS